MTRDPRFEHLPVDQAYYRCPATDCTTEDHGVFVVVVRAPDGRQRALWACIEHLPTELAARLNDLRLKPPPV